MRHIDVESLWGADVVSRDRLSVADVLRHLPYVVMGGLIPPLTVVNAVLGAGELDAGMSGGARWQPVQLTLQEYEAVVADLVENGCRGTPLQYRQPPAWVIDRNDWSIWVAEQAYSIPSAENRVLSAEMDQLQVLMHEAERCGDEDAWAEYASRLNAKAAEWSAFVQKHRSAVRRQP